MRKYLFPLVALLGLAACGTVKPSGDEVAFCQVNGGVKQVGTPTGVGGGQFPTVCNNGTWTRFVSSTSSR